MVIETHKHSANTETWIDNRKTYDNTVKDFILYSIKFSTDRQNPSYSAKTHWENLIGILEKNLYVENVDFKCLILSGEMSDGITHFLIQTDNKMCPDAFDKIYLILKEYRDTYGKPYRNIIETEKINAKL